MRFLLIVVIAAVAAGAVHASGGSEPPQTAFQITGSELLYDRDDTLRWQASGGSAIHVQTERNQILEYEVLSENVIGVWEQGDNRRVFSYFMFRIGSPEYQRMAAFRECVANNRGRKLFEVEDCGDPLPG